MKEIIKLVKDVDVFVAQQKSPNFIKIANETKYQPIIVKADKITDVLLILNKAFQEIYNDIKRRKNGEYFNTIPELE